MARNYAAPGPKLKKLWQEWVEMHRVLNKGLAIKPAAPFFSAQSTGKRDSTILFVGKATKGDWELSRYQQSLRISVDAGIDDRLQCNREHIQKLSSGFWTLLRSVASIQPATGLEGVVWTNVAKIGAQKGNPSGLLLSAQADLAERTLHTEIAEYRPALVIFVTGTFGDQIIKRAVGIPDAEWQKSTLQDQDQDVWWKTGRPAFLWTRHPERKDRETINHWKERAIALLSEG